MPTASGCSRPGSASGSPSARRYGSVPKAFPPHALPVRRVDSPSPSSFPVSSSCRIDSVTPGADTTLAAPEFPVGAHPAAEPEPPAAVAPGERVSGAAGLPDDRRLSGEAPAGRARPADRRRCTSRSTPSSHGGRRRDGRERSRSGASAAREWRGCRSCSAPSGRPSRVVVQIGGEAERMDAAVLQREAAATPELPPAAAPLRPGVHDPGRPEHGVQPAPRGRAAAGALAADLPRPRRAATTCRSPRRRWR